MTQVRGPETEADFTRRLGRREVSIGMIGLGYTGLPLAVASAGAGFRTFGYDRDPEVCAGLERGASHIEDVTSATLRAVTGTGRLTFTTTAGGIAPAPDVVFICVPTPFGTGPDLSHVTGAARVLGAALRPGMVVIAQSTSYPGTTTEVIQPLLEAGGLRAGADAQQPAAGQALAPPAQHLHDPLEHLAGHPQDLIGGQDDQPGAGLQRAGLPRQEPRVLRNARPAPPHPRV